MQKFLVPNASHQRQQKAVRRGTRSAAFCCQLDVFVSCFFFRFHSHPAIGTNIAAHSHCQLFLKKSPIFCVAVTLTSIILSKVLIALGVLCPSISKRAVKVRCNLCLPSSFGCISHFHSVCCLLETAWISGVIAVI